MNSLNILRVREIGGEGGEERWNERKIGEMEGRVGCECGEKWEFGL